MCVSNDSLFTVKHIHTHTYTHTHTHTRMCVSNDVSFHCETHIYTHIDLLNLESREIKGLREGVFSTMGACK